MFELLPDAPEVEFVEWLRAMGFRLKSDRRGFIIVVPSTKE